MGDIQLPHPYIDSAHSFSSHWIQTLVTTTTMSNPRLRVRTPSGNGSKWSTPSSSDSTCRDVRRNCAVSSSSPGSTYSCHRRISKQSTNNKPSSQVDQSYRTEINNRRLTLVLVFSNGLSRQRQLINVVLKKRSPLAQLVQKGPRSRHSDSEHH